MKIVFLDFDGVLVNRASLLKQSGGQAVADPDCVKHLKWITRLTGAKIVVSSSWRATGLEDMRKTLSSWSVDAECVGITPINHSEQRGWEIQKWLEAHPATRRWKSDQRREVGWETDGLDTPRYLDWLRADTSGCTLSIVL